WWTPRTDRSAPAAGAAGRRRSPAGPRSWPGPRPRAGARDSRRLRPGTWLRTARRAIRSAWPRCAGRAGPWASRSPRPPTCATSKWSRSAAGCPRRARSCSSRWRRRCTRTPGSASCATCTSCPPRSARAPAWWVRRRSSSLVTGTGPATEPSPCGPGSDTLAGMTTSPLPSPDDVVAARQVLNDVVLQTPLLHSRVLSEQIGGPVYLKCENLQRTGSFKARGAYLRIARLAEARRARGVVAASAGNHGQGVAFAAALLGTKATVVMPEGAPLPKVEATGSYGAEVVLHGSAVEDALARAQELAAEQDLVFIHPFEHADVVT